MGRGSKRATHDLPATSTIYATPVILDKTPMKGGLGLLSSAIRQPGSSHG